MVSAVQSTLDPCPQERTNERTSRFVWLNALLISTAGWWRTVETERRQDSVNIMARNSTAARQVHCLLTRSEYDSLWVRVNSDGSGRGCPRSHKSLQFAGRASISCGNCVWRDVLQSLVQAFVHCRLDYCNSLLTVIANAKGQVKRVQAVRNAAFRLVSGAWCRDHVTPLLRRLHWLPAAVLVWKCIHGVASVYMQELYTRACLMTICAVVKWKHSVENGNLCSFVLRCRNELFINNDITILYSVQL